ncbi:MAG: BadF/BadG/BcrA/BcrD ATPase family protein [Paraglaciecola sp.]|uniref:N-acetylglucosamine kinase n=1 Tax=Paraglaciecola sp. TaxID=1920173 RepID=UPI0032995C62
MVRSKAERYWVGVDGGGTKCKVVIMNDRLEVLANYISGPANPYQDLSLAINSISLGIEEAAKLAGLHNRQDKFIVGMGLAGVNVPRVFQLVDNWQNPYKSCHLTTDLHIACLGAHESDEGAVIVAGTGSCGYATSKNDSLLIGAHGFPAGDKGSGAWLGLKAIESVLLADNGLYPPTMLTELLFEQLQVTSCIEIVDCIQKANQNYYAQFAIQVFCAANKGDVAALQIVDDGAKYLSDVGFKLLDFGAKRLAMIGGVSQAMKKWMNQELIMEESEPLNSPEFGAVLFARNHEMTS